MKEQPDKPANAGSEEEALAAKLRRVVPALREIPMRTLLLMSELSLAGRDVRVSARALDLVASAAEQADPASREVIAALLPALLGYVASSVRKRITNARRGVRVARAFAVAPAQAIARNDEGKTNAGETRGRNKRHRPRAGRSAALARREASVGPRAVTRHS